MHLETEHPAYTPLLGLGQQGCPFPQNILSQLTSSGLMKSLKRITTISSQCTRISKPLLIELPSNGKIKYKKK